MESGYLIRYGLSRQIGRFVSESPDFARGQTVVVRSHRGTELGEVLIKETSNGEIHSSAPPAGMGRVLRAADRDDLERARQLDRERPRRFDLCRRVIQDLADAMELLDVELLLDGQHTVLHYLGAPSRAPAELVALFRSTCAIDVLLEAVGSEPSVDPGPPGQDGEGGCGRCGHGGCGMGGCAHETDTSSVVGCSGCQIKQILATRARRPVAVH